MNLLDRELPHVDTENGEEYVAPSWQRDVYAAGTSVIPRKKPSKAEQAEILAGQNNCCLFCGNEIGAMVLRNGKRITLLLHWDHFVPYAYQGSNRGFVASCHICNGIKSCHSFQTLDEARRYILSRWRAKGIEGGGAGLFTVAPEPSLSCPRPRMAKDEQIERLRKELATAKRVADRTNIARREVRELRADVRRIALERDALLSETRALADKLAVLRQWIFEATDGPGPPEKALRLLRKRLVGER